MSSTTTSGFQNTPKSQDPRHGSSSLKTNIAPLNYKISRHLGAPSWSHLGAREEYWARYINTLSRHQVAISMDKYDLGLAKDFTHRIQLKDDKLIYRKQFNLSEAHNRFIDQTLDEWLKLGVVRKTRSPYNSMPMRCQYRN